MPHGLAGGLISVATARALNFLSPWLTAAPIATLSAHVPTGYDALSTFTPSINWSLSVRTQEPTRNREYGQCALSLAARLREWSVSNWALVIPCSAQACETCEGLLEERSFMIIALCVDRA
jgi:hypothetical protein